MCNMPITSKQLSDLIQYSSGQNSSNHFLSLSGAHKQNIVTFEHASFDLLDAENSTTSLLFYQYIDNSSSVYFVANDTFSNRTRVGIRPRTSTEIPIWLIPCYSIILIFAIVGNLLVASTLFQNRRMRTITNVFLANLAISDLLLGVLCMPITLVGTYLRHFIFGELVCKFIQFAQAASVAVSSWTLVAISCERYYAICHPLRSRTWQTINHAYKIIGCIWFGSIICMAPIAIFSQLIPTSRQGLRKCREQWPQEAVGYERLYNILLDLALLVLPLAILCVAYILITRTLYTGIKDEKALIFGNKSNNSGNSVTGDGKMYTQVMAEMKTPTVFHLNMSFRYHARKATATSITGYCTENGETLQTVNTRNNKYSAMGLISPSAVGKKYRRRGLCYHPSSTGAEAETEFPSDGHREVVTELTQSSFQSKCSDDVTNFGSGKQDEIAPTTARATPSTPTHDRTTNSLNEQCPQLYCKRSSSVKSFNCNRIAAEANKQEADNISSVSINTTSSSRFSRTQYCHQSLKQKQLRLHQHQHQQQQSKCGLQQPITEISERRQLNSSPNLRFKESTLRRSNLAKNLESKKRVVKMLFVLVLEFFICWTPLYVINTVAMFIGPAIYEYVDYTTISFFQLLAYSSSCCNPITYCFMNASFRRAFADTFKGMHLNNRKFGRRDPKAATNLSVVANSITIANSCTVVTTNMPLDSPRL